MRQMTTVYKNLFPKLFTCLFRNKPFFQSSWYINHKLSIIGSIFTLLIIVVKEKERRLKDPYVRFYFSLERKNEYLSRKKSFPYSVCTDCHINGWWWCVCVCASILFLWVMSCTISLGILKRLYRLYLCSTRLLVACTWSYNCYMHQLFVFLPKKVLLCKVRKHLF